jgi:hypothetical protein
LRDFLPAPEARIKTVSALARAWIAPPEAAAEMIRWAQDRAESVGDARVLHIGALLAVHPFLADAWAAVGRELLFRGDVHMESIRKRLLAEWGQREAIRVGARAAMRTLRSLGVLKGKTGDPRSLPGDRLVVPEILAPWIVHALCLARNASEVGLSEATSAPALFMLEMPATFSEEYPLLEKLVEGGDRKLFRVRRASWSRPSNTN